MKRSLFFALLICLSTALSAQEQKDTTYWKTAGVAGINMSQVSLTNWAAGGDASVAFDLNFSYGFDYNKDKRMWSNRLELAYGLNNTTSNGTRKTNDKIFFTSNYGYEISNNLYLSAALTFNTQFAEGYNYGVSTTDYISTFMAPGYLSFGPGLTWTPKSWFKASISPATWRETFVLDDALSALGAFGVDPGKKMRAEFGGNLTAEVTHEFLPNMTLYTRLNLFSDYLGKPQNIDIRWDTQVNMKINKWFSANLQLNMIYDDDTIITDKNGNSGPRVQFKEVLGVGLQVNF
jgi:Protein of unknown function (DUF3078).